MGSEVEYRKFAERAGFAVEAFEDLSLRVRRTWEFAQPGLRASSSLTQVIAGSSAMRGLATASLP